MSSRTIEELFALARTLPEYHKELAILSFTEELCRVMEEQGVTHTELARRIGKSQAYISRVLNGGANFTLGSMTMLSAALSMELRTELVPQEPAIAGTGEVDVAEHPQSRKSA